MANDKCCCYSVWCCAIIFCVLGIIGTTASLISDHYAFAYFATFIAEERRQSLVAPLGHALSVRDYIQLGIYISVLCNVACYHSVCLWLILTILQACDWVFKFGVFVAVTTVSIMYGNTCRTQVSEYESVDCYLFMTIYIACMILQVLMDLLFNFILYKCWRSERAVRGDTMTTTFTAEVEEKCGNNVEEAAPP